MSGKTIKHKRSSVSGNIPNTSQVSIGELAINFADRSLYTQNTSNEIIELSRDVIKSSVQPTAPSNGEIWYNTTTGFLSLYDANQGWIPLIYNGKEVLAGNISSATGFSGGSGTDVDPYVYSSTVNVETYGIDQYVDTITVTGLVPSQVVEIVDTSSTTNEGRFIVSNKTADDTGTLTFTIMFTDFPESIDDTDYTATFKIGSGSVYLDVDVNVSEIKEVPQDVNHPENTKPDNILWFSENDTITASGCYEVSKDGTNYENPLDIETSDTLYVKWSGRPGSGTCIDDSHGETITGTLTYSNGSSDTRELVIDKEPNQFFFVGDSGVETDTVTTSNPVEVAGFNSYAYLYYDSSSATGVEYSKNGSAFVAMPSSLQGAISSLVYLEEEDTFEVRHTSSSNQDTTVSTRVFAGETSSVYSTKTADLSVEIETPRIVSPADGEENLSPKPEIISSDYRSIGNNPAGHSESEWELYADSSTPVLIESSTKTSDKLKFIPEDILEPETTYYARVLYRDSNGEESQWSNPSYFTTEKQKGTLWTFHGSNEEIKQFLFSGSRAPNNKYRYFLKFNHGPASDVLAKWSEEMTGASWVTQKATKEAYWKTYAQSATKMSLYGGYIGDGASRKPVLLRIKGYSGAEDILDRLPDLGIGPDAGGYYDDRGLHITIDEHTQRFWVAAIHDNTFTDHRIWYSDDEGITFTKSLVTSNHSLKGSTISAFTRPDGSNVVMLVFSGYRETSGYGYYSYSTDNGATWNYSSSFADLGFVGANDTSNIISYGKYVYAYRSRNGVGAVKFGILRSEDLINWTDITANLNAVKPQPFELNTHPELYVDKAGQLLCVDDQGDFLISTDYGDTWKKDTSLSETGWGQTPITAFQEIDGKYYINNAGSGKWATSP